MNIKHVATITVLGIALLIGGCGGNSGLLLRIVPIETALGEITISKDKGWFVSDKVVLIDVDGMILNAREQSWAGESQNPVSVFVEKLDKAAADSDVKAVVIRINSPGGTVTASDMMYRSLVQFRKSKKVPVIAVIEDVGASGGYYLACGADKIVAYPTSITGSIGVIMQTFSVARTLSMLGVESKAITSGPYKDLASPLKPLNAEDRKVLSGMVDEFYAGFLAVVSKGRSNLTTKKIRKLADGRVYTGVQAYKNGLVDELGTTQDAVLMARKLANISKARLVTYQRGNGYRANVHNRSNVGPQQFNLINITTPKLLDMNRPRFLYLWTGSSVSN